MGGKIGIVEGLNRISEDFAKNFAGSWTAEELKESAKAFNATNDIDLRNRLFCRFLNTKYVHYVKIEAIGFFQTDFIFERRLPGFMQRDTRETKVNVTGSSLVILKKEMVRWGCQHTISYPTWVKKRKIPLLKIKVQIKGDTLLVTLG